MGSRQVLGAACTPVRHQFCLIFPHRQAATFLFDPITPFFMAALFACIPIIHLVIGLLFILAPEKFGHGSQQPPAFIGWFFVAFASAFILVGWTLAVLILSAGKCIAHRKHYTFCFVMTCVECIFMPFGTVLGVFTILVLNRQSVKELFNPRPAARSNRKNPGEQGTYRLGGWADTIIL